MPAPHSSRGAVRTKLCAFFESKKTPKTGRARQAKAKGQTKTEKAVQLTASRGERAKKKPKKKQNRKLTGRFELPSTDSESVVIAATLREQGMQPLRVAQYQ